MAMADRVLPSADCAEIPAASSAAKTAVLAAALSVVAVEAARDCPLSPAPVKLTPNIEDSRDGEASTRDGVVGIFVKSTYGWSREVDI